MRESSDNGDMENSEREIVGFLKKLGIYSIYEAPVFVYDEKKRPRVWTPDFYLPQWGLYIEVCGDERFDYNYREKIYKENGLFVIFVHYYKDKDRWRTYLQKRLLEIDEYRHLKAMQMKNKAS